jgi:D-alanyl-D-alanine carboxypeptidase-like protein
MAGSLMPLPINIADYSRTAAQRGWGAGWPSCGGARNNLATVTFRLSGVRVTVHKRIARLVQLLGDATEARGYRAKLGQTGAYNCRPISGTQSPSNHSWGLALDWNWTDNPYTTNPALNHIPGWMVALWNRFGFAWGGAYSGTRKDYMHFEFMGWPEDADAMTALALTELNQGDEDMAQVPQQQWDETRNAILTLTSVLLTKRKPWYGGISDRSVSNPAEMGAAEEYDALMYILRNNVTENQNSIGVAQLRQEVAALNQRVSSLIQILGAQQGVQL